MTADGNCTITANKCLPDTYCPATDSTEVSCKACNFAIPSGNGCNCVANTPVTNCQACSNGACSKCLSGFGVSNTKCEQCLVNSCLECSTPDVCTSCEGSLKLHQNTCVQPCKQLSDCSQNQFCDLESSTCQNCVTGCQLCDSTTICTKCSEGRAINITGGCDNACANLSNGQYCDNGTAKTCAEGLNQACQCTAAKNCASCTVDEKSCLECIPGFKMMAGICSQCAAGYDKVNELCLKSNGGGGDNGGDDNVADGGDKTKLSGGAIAGIVIAILVVVCGISGGLAYFFIKKNKSGANVSAAVASQ